ncbi:transferase [Microbacterium sp. LWO14-1.2]|uniref:LpxD N-terminal domain-containing protein n=1 Tax=Microbacterium sp. LWO14-1.2 TaxID=3135263 RepID=UPI00313909FC
MIAADLSASLIGPDAPITGIAPLDGAALGDLTFVTDVAKYSEALARALASGAIVLAPIDAPETPTAGSTIAVDNPRAAFAQSLTRHFARRPEPGVSPTARVHPEADVHPSAHIGEYTVVRAGARIGASAEIRDHVVVGHDVVIGDRTLVKSHAVIGEEGFGMEKDAAGDNIRIPHVGSVVIGDDAEIGNFTTVCSGTIVPTRIGDHTKVDDHVHVAHNCQIGRNVIVTACAEISGSVTVEDNAWIGPNASIIQGVTLGSNSLLGIGAVALKSVPADEVRVGNPAKKIGTNAP